MNSTKISRQTLSIKYPKLSKIVEKQESILFKPEILNLFETALDSKIGFLPYKFINFNPEIFFRANREEVPVFTKAIDDGKKVIAYLIENIIIDVSFYYFK